jgi:hypothetical protein
MRWLHPAPEPLAGDLLVRDVRTIGFEGETPAVRAHAFVLVKDGKILAVRDTAEGLSAPDIGGRRRAARLVPGLTDMHVHIWDEAELGAYLSWGVTRVRNMSGLPFHLPLAKRIEAGEVMGPHLITTGPILNSPGPNAQINHQMVETADEARAAVAWQAEAGFERIKVYSNLTRPAYEAIIEEAAARGHAGRPATRRRACAKTACRRRSRSTSPFEEVLADHFETIEHIESVVWHGLRNRHDEDGGAGAGPEDRGRRRAGDGDAAGAPEPAAGGGDGRRGGEPSGNGVPERWWSSRPRAAISTFWAGQDPAPVAEDAAFYAQRGGDLPGRRRVTLLAGTDAGIFTNIPGKSLGEELASC